MPTMVTGLITTLYQVSTLPSFHFPNHVSGVVLHLCHSLVSRSASGGGKPGHVHRIHDLFIFTACPGEMFLSYAKSLQSCLTPCNPMDCSWPGSSVHGILQARIAEWVAVPSSRRSSWPRYQTRVSCIDRCIFTTRTTWEAPWEMLLSPFYRWKSWGSERLISLLSYPKSPSFPTLLREDWQGMVF